MDNHDLEVMMIRIADQTEIAHQEMQELHKDLRRLIQIMARIEEKADRVLAKLIESRNLLGR